MGERSHERYCAAVEAEVGRFLELVKGGDPTVPVPTCPGRAVAGLIRHHGTTHRWMEYLVRHQVIERVASRDVPLGLPGDVTAYPAWLAESATASLRTFRAADPDAPMWSPGADQHVRFFPRRLLFEAVVHRADVEIALGGVPRVTPEIATDGVEELLENMPFFARVAKRVRGLDRDGETLHLHATDAEAGWTIEPRDGGFTWRRGPGEGSVAVRASAGDLLLLVYGRLRPDDDRLTVSGDRDLLTAWLAAGAF